MSWRSAGTILAVAILASGCFPHYSELDGPGSTLPAPPAATAHAKNPTLVFACQSWEDKDGNDVAGFPYEFSGLRHSFRGEDPLMIVSILDTPGLQGRPWLLQVSGPAGQPVEQVSAVLSEDYVVMKIGGPGDRLAERLLARGGPGTYKATVLVDGEPVSLCTFELLATVPTCTVGYVIAPGESLSVIAARFGLTVDELVKRNNLDNPNAIRAGRKLLLWPAAAEHTVQEGETLAALAQRHGTTPEALRCVNKLERDALSAGQVLLVPAAQPLKE